MNNKKIAIGCRFMMMIFIGVSLFTMLRLLGTDAGMLFSMLVAAVRLLWNVNRCVCLEMKRRRAIKELDSLLADMGL